MRVVTKFIILLLSLVLWNGPGFAEVTGPTRDLFIGDFELFTCHAEAKLELLKWQYKIENKIQDVHELDMIEDNLTIDRNGTLRRSILRVIPGLSQVLCVGDEQAGSIPIEYGTTSVHVYDFKKVDPFSDPTCNETITVMMKRWDSTKNQYWAPHYVTNELVHVPSTVSGLKLTCMSKNKIKWIIHHDLKEFRYWTSENEHGCHIASLILSPLNPTSSQEYICGQDKDGSTVTIDYALTRDHHMIDFNKTSECIEQLGDTIFGSNTLGWTTAGSSLASVGMMVGIVFLKKQLDKQKNTSRRV